jgi:hypothetical protein
MDQSSKKVILAAQDWLFDAGLMGYVSSAYLSIWLPVVMGAERNL